MLHGLRRFTLLVGLLALLFPATAGASWYGDAWNSTKHGMGNVLEFGYGAMEVGWEGIYGAGCGLKNLATWNGNSCDSTVAEAGESFRSLVHDLDNCVMTFEPTGLGGFGASTTEGADGVEMGQLGLSEAEIDAVIEAAASDPAGAGSTSMEAYLKSEGARRALAKNPAWKKVARGFPVAKYAVLVSSISMNCSATINFVMYGVDNLVTGDETWIKRDGLWYHCTKTCQLDPESLPDTDPPLPPRSNPTGDPQVMSTFCGPVATLPGEDAPDRDVLCLENLREAATACANGTMRGNAADLCPRLLETFGDDGTQTETRWEPVRSPRDSLDPGSVPGGSVSGSCAAVIRTVSSGAARHPGESGDLEKCLGTDDPTCQKLRARAATGAPLDLGPALQRRCFG